MAVYDSAKTRSAGNQIKNLAESMDGSVLPFARQASETLENFRGRTAQVMEEEMANLLRSSLRLQGELAELAHRINIYANMLEQADAKLAEEL